MALDFDLTEEQKMIVETVRKFKEKECPKEKIREWDKTETFPSHIWKKLGEIGLLGAAFPEQFGGTGGGIVEEMLITEELSYGFSDLGLTYLLGVCFGGISILEQGTDAQKEKYLPPLINGETNFCLSLTEPGGGTDILGALKSRAKEDGDHFTDRRGDFEAQRQAGRSGGNRDHEQPRHGDYVDQRPLENAGSGARGRGGHSPGPSGPKGADLPPVRSGPARARPRVSRCLQGNQDYGA